MKPPATVPAQSSRDSPVPADGTFSVAAYAGYRRGQHHFYVGYKHFELDLESGGGGDLTVARAQCSDSVSRPAIRSGEARSSLLRGTPAIRCLNFGRG